MLISYGPIFRFFFKCALSLSGNRRIREAIEPVKPASFAYLDELLKKQTVLQRAMQDKWDALGIDAVIMPNYPIPAFRHENFD
jgi:hypothetical protein